MKKVKFIETKNGDWFADEISKALEDGYNLHTVSMGVALGYHQSSNFHKALLVKDDNTNPFEGFEIFDKVKIKLKGNKHEYSGIVYAFPKVHYDDTFYNIVIRPGKKEDFYGSIDISTKKHLNGYLHISEVEYIKKVEQ